MAENVVADVYTEDKQELVLNALHRATFDSKLAALENGIDTPLTREFSDKGVNLSGGEAQKIAIARRDRISKSSYSDAQYKSVLYLDDMPEEDDVKDTWLADKSDFTDDIMAAFLKEEFISTLTTRQKEVFDNKLFPSRINM